MHPHELKGEIIMKLTTYIAIIDLTDNRNTMKFVTSLEGRMALWEAGKPAMALSEARAKDIVLGLCVNGYNATLIKAPSFMSFNNKEEE